MKEFSNYEREGDKSYGTFFCRFNNSFLISGFSLRTQFKPSSFNFKPYRARFSMPQIWALVQRNPQIRV